MKRGEVWWADFANALDAEHEKLRAVVIVSNNHANAALDRVQVVPISSHSETCYPCEALIMLHDKPAKAMADQITTIRAARLKSKIDCLTEDQLQALDQAICVQLEV